MEFIKTSIIEIKGKLGRAGADGDEAEARDLQQRLASAQARETSLTAALATMAEDISDTEAMEEERGWDQRRLAYCRFWRDYLPIREAMLRAQQKAKQLEEQNAEILRGEGKSMAGVHYRRFVQGQKPFPESLMQPAGDGPNTASECAEQAKRATALVVELEAKIAAYDEEENQHDK